MTQRFQPSFCTKCGTAFTANDKFCGECGTPRTLKPDSPPNARNQYQGVGLPSDSYGFWSKLSTFGKITVIAVPLLLIIGIGACLTIGLSPNVADMESVQTQNNSKPAASTTTSEANTINPGEVIDIDDFWAERSSNLINFESKYMNTTVQVSGVANSPIDVGGSYRFSIASTNPYALRLEDIYCITDKETAVSLSSGQKVIVSGTLTASNDFLPNYHIKNCKVIQKDPTGQTSNQNNYDIDATITAKLDILQRELDAQSNQSVPEISTTTSEANTINPGEVIDIDDFWAERSSNLINFESKYMNTTVQVSGVANSPIDVGGSYRFSIVSTNPYNIYLEDIYCITDKQTAVSLSSGQEIVVSGTLTKSDDWLATYDIKNCKVR